MKQGAAAATFGLVLCGLSGTIGLIACGSDETSDRGNNSWVDASTEGSSGAAGVSGAGGAGGTGACSNCGPLEQCWAGKLCVAKLASMSGAFGIDATEVTQSQYSAWLANSPVLSDQPPECAWNAEADSFKPTCQWPPETGGNQPVVCVDWCDAYAYCKAVGKRLCGKVGGGPGVFGKCADASVSQWYAACSSGGKYNYPYGGTPGVNSIDGFDGQKCNGWENTVTGCGSGTCVTVEGGSLAACQSSESGYQGAYDLSGNVMEWEDACNEANGKNDSCPLRGGALGLSASSLTCGLDYVDYRVASKVDVGFRCCSTP